MDLYDLLDYLIFSILLRISIFFDAIGPNPYLIILIFSPFKFYFVIDITFVPKESESVSIR